MDASDPAPRAGFVSRRVHKRFTTAPSSSQAYSHITANGSSRMHNGNNYYITYECSTGLAPWSMLPSDQQAAIEQGSRPLQKRKRSVNDVSGTTHGNRERQTLSTVLESLGQYLKSIQQQSQGEDSRKLAAAMMLILESLEQSVSHGKTTESLGHCVQDLEHQLRRARRIKINSPSPQAQSSRVYKANSKTTRIISELWEISLTTKTLHSRSTDGQTLIETCSALRVERAHGSRSPYIAAFFSESSDVDRTVTLHPVVMAYNQLESDSEVFELIENNDLVGLMRLFARGQASIRDCDEEGRSLLHYACYHASEEICKFLVDSGCDLDRIALSLQYDHEKGTPLSILRYLKIPADGHGFERSMICRKHLLQANADPTLGIVDTRDDSVSSSTIIESLENSTGATGITDTFEQILRENSVFFDIRSFRERGQSIWMHACSKAGSLISPKILSILVQAGAMIAEVDDDGWNCLFKCVQGSLSPSDSKEFEALRFLLSVFDDIHATDSERLSLFDLVNDYEEPSRYEMGGLGSYTQDLWYCALYRSGLAHRSDVPLPLSPLIFTSRYTIQHYRALMFFGTWDSWSWRGRTARLPLFNDEVFRYSRRDTNPCVSEWGYPDLEIMEERANRAIYLNEDDEDTWRTYQMARRRRRNPRRGCKANVQVN